MGFLLSKMMAVFGDKGETDSDDFFFLFVIFSKLGKNSINTFFFVGHGWHNFKW